MDEPLILVANPGSASRKYALYQADKQRAGLHFETTAGGVKCTLEEPADTRELDVQISDVSDAVKHVTSLLRKNNILATQEQIDRIGLRVVAPNSFFLEDRIIDDTIEAHLASLANQAPIHINATLRELRHLHKEFPSCIIVGVSDSKFHITKPDHAWNYGLPLEDSDKYEIKRYGYHGISIESAVKTLQTSNLLLPKTIVAHIGSGVSITALHNGKSVDTSMGYSPLDGVVMATRSGGIDFTAALALKSARDFTDDQLDEYLNKQSGLLGLGGSADIPVLLQRESDSDHKAQLALQIYVYAIQKAIGQMTAALNGIDSLIFTGAVGERSAIIRNRIISQFHYLGFTLDHASNDSCLLPTKPTTISKLLSKPIHVIPAQEAKEIARRTSQIH